MKKKEIQAMLQKVKDGQLSLETALDSVTTTRGGSSLIDLTDTNTINAFADISNGIYVKTDSKLQFAPLSIKNKTYRIVYRGAKKVVANAPVKPVAPAQYKGKK